MTCDTDWCTPIQLQEAIRIFGDIPVTYFSTGGYKVLDEIALETPKSVCPHPNIEGKHHKSCEFENKLMKALNEYPQAEGYRCHGHTDSAWIQMKMKELGYTWESNMCCHLETGLKPMTMFSGLVRLPVWLEDDVWMDGGKQDGIREMRKALDTNGMKVFNFHPVHICNDIRVRSLLEWIMANVDEWTTIEREVEKWTYQRVV
jgi:hypothetical protein